MADCWIVVHVPEIRDDEVMGQPEDMPIAVCFDEELARGICAEAEQERGRVNVDVGFALQAARARRRVAGKRSGWTDLTATERTQAFNSVRPSSVDPRVTGSTNTGLGSYVVVGPVPLRVPT